jgi:hypothetical protein
MNDLLIFFFAQAAAITVCATAYVSVATFPHPDKLCPDARGTSGLAATD